MIREVQVDMRQGTLLSHFAGHESTMNSRTQDFIECLGNRVGGFTGAYDEDSRAAAQIEGSLSDGQPLPPAP